MNSRIIHRSLLRPQLQTIGNFLINPSEMLGQGSFSRIFKGTDKRTGQQVAVKVIDLAMIEANGLRKFLDREVKINAKVDHQYVLKCYEISYSASHCYLVTEFCPEGDLQRYIQRKGKLPEYQALRLLRQLIMGLKYLHDQQILHRDLKSSNVFIHNSEVKIADFGLSHNFSNGVVQERVLIGTPAYMAPETLLNNQYSYKCDVWALGNIFVEMLTGKAPFMQNCTLDQLKGLFLGGVRVRLDNISQKCSELVDAMLKMDKNQRISVEELYQRLCGEDSERLNWNNSPPSMVWNIKSSRTESSQSEDPKVNLLEYALECVKEFHSAGMMEMVHLIICFAKLVVKEDIDSLRNTWEQQRILKAICRYDTSKVLSRRNLDVEYFTYYLEQAELELRGSSTNRSLMLQELLQLVHAYRDGSLSRVRWHKDSQYEPPILCSPNFRIAKQVRPYKMHS